ncbi:uncharacterized protein BO80DRAFT_363641 [Aspergillus ibericus CBS 121593]|uniref:Uncharacterized protein n=1 Tax=Aspergillus ibericus CBS 121593 TaxID=1448316 RepID=A0A395GS85_9EURO|nr:hypothetical protein BO80DRAFT_363641 [Aspergillus ibericus CBS 121593]RAK97567.1 hypothetical protein BO80DRAFT_363641 [Aspergillus ibericus CBS 121593]
MTVGHSTRPALQNGIHLVHISYSSSNLSSQTQLDGESLDLGTTYTEAYRSTTADSSSHGGLSRSDTGTSASSRSLRATERTRRRWRPVLMNSQRMLHSFRSGLSDQMGKARGRLRWRRIQSDSRQSGLGDHFLALLKSLGVTSFYNTCCKLRGVEVTEKPKVFMYRSKTLASIRCVLHVVPVGAAFALLMLNSAGYYIGGELSGASGQDTEKLAALTFAAKLHELLMLASLGSILITYIRRELAFGEGLPFGAIFTSLQFQDISFLWSLSMWGSIQHDWQRRSTKWFILSLMVICTLLGLTVGPSTSNLMKPRLGDWPAGGTPFWINCTKDVLFPRTVENSSSLSHCALDNSDLACPAGNWQILNQDYYSFFPRLVDAGSVPQNITVSGAASIRTFGMRSRNLFGSHEMMWGNAYTIATTPLSVVADSVAELGRLWSYAAANIDVGRFKFRNDALFTVNSLQPVVLTFCGQTFYDFSNNLTLSFPALGTASLSGGPGTADTSQASVKLYDGYSNDVIQKQVKSLLQQRSSPSVLWVDDPNLLQPLDATLAAILTLPGTDSSNPQYFTCSVDSRFTNVTLISTRNAIKIVAGQPIDMDKNGTFHADWPRIALTADWAKYLTPVIPGTNETILSPITSMAGIFNSPTPSASYYHDIIVENILATLITNGIGRSAYNHSIIMNLKGAVDQSDLWDGGDWIYDIIPKGGNMGKGRNAFNVSAAVRNQSTELAMTAYVNGYAYSAAGITSVLEMVVLAIYIAVAIAHVCYSIYSGLSSSSWGSAPEIAVLAWNSVPTEKMANTGAGISTVDIYKHNIRVMHRGNKLEIVTRDNEESPEKGNQPFQQATTNVDDVHTGSDSDRTDEDMEPVEENQAYC